MQSSNNPESNQPNPSATPNSPAGQQPSPEASQRAGEATQPGAAVPADKPADASAAPNPPGEPPAKSPISREVQDRAIQTFVTTSYEQLLTASTDPEISKALRLHGYDEEEFSIGAARIKHTSECFGIRLLGMGGEDKTHDELAAAMEAARVGYLTFRTIGRGAFPETADQMSLGLVGRLREDFRVFVTRAQSSYENAAKEPFTAKMTKRGYPPARLKTLSDELDVLIKRFSAASAAQGAAMKSTEERDESYRSLREFMKEFKAVCRGVFRGEPSTLKKLKL